MRTIGTYELKTHLAEVLDAVENGQTVIVTRRGKAIARICPSAQERHRRVAAAVDGLEKFPRTPLPKGLTLRDLIAEGRR